MKEQDRFKHKKNNINMKYINIKTLLAMLCFTWSMGIQAQTEFFNDDCSSTTGWTLGQGSTSGSSYTAWRIGSTCSIDGSTLGINAWNGSSWYCEYWWDIDASNYIIAYKTVDATNYENLDFTFDYVSDGNGSDYGRIGYSTDGGSTFTWLYTGGPYGDGKYYNKSSIQRDNSISFPSSLDEISFQIAFRWKNNSSGGDDPAMYVDNLRLSGDEVSTGPSTYEEFYVNDCSSSSEWTLGQGNTSGSLYTAWRIGTTSTIDGSTIGVNAWNGSYWLNEYWWNINNSSGIVAHTTVDASSHENLKLKFDFLADGNSSDYGKVGYSTDGGTTFTWIDTGGKLGAGKYYNLNTINRDEEIILPASLDATSFEVAFIWYNNASGGDDPAFYLDNIRVGGDIIEPDKDTVVVDNMNDDYNWILEESSNLSTEGNYIAWRFDDTCTIDSTVLAIMTYNQDSTEWTCGYYNDLDNSSGIIARREVIAVGFKNLDLYFDWQAGGENNGSTAVDYAQVGYTLDNGATYTWFTTGGSNGNGDYYNESSTQFEKVVLPTLLDNEVFQIAFKWTNNASIGTDPGFVLDNMTVKGERTALVMTTIASDDFETANNWTLASTNPNGNDDYTSWNISSNCSINNKSLVIQKRDGTDLTWNCGIASSIDNSDGIIASRAIEASNTTNLTLTFNWKCDSEGLPEYGSVVYSLDGGQTWITLDYGGDGAGRYFQNSSVVSETIILPSTLDNTNFLIGFQWQNDNQQAGAIPFTIDDLTIKGIYTGTDLFGINVSNVGTINSVWVEVIRESGKQNESQVDVLDEWGKQMSISYIDGLGRKIQNVSYRSTANHKDFVQPIVYNKYGHSNVNFLPYPNSVNTGAYTKNWSFDQYITHKVLKVEDYPWARAVVEKSPNAKIDEQGSVGEIFQPGGATLKQTFTAVKDNHSPPPTTLNDAYKRIVINSSGTLTAYVHSLEAGRTRLAVNETIDEEGVSTKSYVNSKGKILMVRKYDGSVKLREIYNVYDDFNRLCFAIQPEGIEAIKNESSGYLMDQAFIDKWCFQYKYDERGRMISKRVPGGGWVGMAYDKWDRLVLTQDAVQLNKNPQEFTFVKYDRLNRPVITGIYSKVGSNMTIASHHIYMNGTEFDEERYELRTDGSGVEDYTTTRTYPDHNTGNAVQKILTVTYYDDYDYSNISGLSFTPTLGYNATDQNTNTAGLATGIKTNILGTTDYLRSVNYYDEHNRVIQVQVQNITGLYSTITSEYDFVGNVIETEEINKARPGSVMITTTINTRNEYDHMNRLTKTFHDINNEGEILLAEYNYNELGERDEKNLHKQGGATTFLQSVDYKYNSKGWLTHINEPDLLTQTGDDNSDLFGMELRYFDNSINQSARKYNGNIAQIEWQNTDGLQSVFDYTYDGLERIKSAVFKELDGTWQTGKFSLTDITYDKNGNIQTAKRNGQLGNSVYGQIDDLTYTYDGNRLLDVSDGVGGSYYGFDFEDGNTSGNDYVYDVNGNLIDDKNKSFTAITYNVLNLVDKVEFDPQTGNEILYIYDANGNKLRKQVKTADVVTRTVDYVNSVQYENDSLLFVSTAEGRAVPAGATYDYEYFLTDHLGNVRVTFNRKSLPGTTNVPKLLNTEDYYPFGMNFNSITLSTNEYKFNGKEIQTDHNFNLYDYGARMFDAALARFTTIDPLAEKYSPWSSYHYALNNPIRYADFMGMGAEEKGKEKKQGAEAKEITEEEIKKMRKDAPKKATSAQMMSMAVTFLAKSNNKNIFIKGSTLSKMSAESSKAAIGELDPKIAKDKEKIEQIEKDEKMTQENLAQIDRISRNDDIISLKPTEEGADISIKTGILPVTIGAKHSIKITKLKTDNVKLEITGVSTLGIKLKGVDITPGLATLKLPFGFTKEVKF
jgi:RHS repeat-associated protein